MSLIFPQIKVEVLKIEKHDEPLHKLLVELISGIRITKLVVGFTFMKSSSWKSRGAISGSFYVHRHKPEFCELFIVCGGKLLFLREDNNEGFIEDDQGVIVAKFKEKGSFRGWLGKKLNENGNNEKFHGSPSPVSSSTRNGFSDQWENCVQEIESYFNQLLSSNSDEEGLEVENDTLWNSQREPEKDIPEIVVSFAIIWILF
ncbi:putative U-box domain-containing protein 50 [Camellia sinensis]|uniref:putative U-box domain-containing protein 50 n=1 Tax=Camellia sinensis TaxID=4442 RepID=UPI001036C3F6|nr:putative U-box domain-containing protein 50 [Camellia sinensis]